VSLIGWSLGGVYARQLAKQCPDDVRLVINLGTASITIKSMTMGLRRPSNPRHLRISW
jgi:homoserine acetyltransferase